MPHLQPIEVHRAWFGVHGASVLGVCCKAQAMKLSAVQSGVERVRGCTTLGL